MGRSSSRNDAQSPGCPARRGPRADSRHRRRIDVVGSPVAVDGGTAGYRDDRSMTGCYGAPGEPVHERVLQRDEGAQTGSGGTHEPIGIGTARMRDGQEHRQMAAVLDNNRGWQGRTFQVNRASRANFGQQEER